MRASALNFGERRPVEIRPAEGNEDQLRAAHGDDVHLAQLNGARRALGVEGHDVGLGKIRHEKERTIGAES